MIVERRDNGAAAVEVDAAGTVEGWAVTTIGSAFELNPPKPPPDALPADAQVTFVPMPAVDAELGAITLPQLRGFADVRKGFTAFEDGDVILAKITPCMENGKAAVARGLTNGFGFGSTEFHVMRPTGAAIPEFLYHFIRQERFRRDAESEMTGSVGQKRVPAHFVETAPFPLAPLAEQHRIVEKIESLLKQVTAARDRLAGVPAILKRFRQSVLAAACSGRLTEDWRAQAGSLQPACALVRQIIGRRRSRYCENNVGAYREPCAARDQRDLPQNWALATIDELTCLVTSGSRGWARFYSDSGPLFIRAQNINTDELRLEEIAHVQPPDTAEGRRTRVKQGDVLLTITGANVTKAALVKRELPTAYVSQHVALLRPVESDTAGFLWLWIVSPAHGRAKLLEDAYGAGRPGLNLDNIRETAIALPPLAEQREILRRVELHFKLADAIEQHVAASSARVEKLTQSILAKAFCGELVPTEVELARQEGRDYEPASVLLERIRAERNGATREGRLGRRRTAKGAGPRQK